MQQNKQAFDEIVTRATEAARAYYAGNSDLMSDSEYDDLIGQIETGLVDQPQWADERTEGLLRAVAGGTLPAGDVTHPSRMLSLAKGGLDEVTTRVREFAGGAVVEPKMDGLALRVEYRAGRLHLAATRGDGTTGDDVTIQARRQVVGLPEVLATEWTGEVRGEVFMDVDNFEQAQKIRAEQGGEPFSNPRNAVAGALRKASGAGMPMSFAVYDLIDGGTVQTHSGRMEVARGLGFVPAADWMVDLQVACVGVPLYSAGDVLAAIDGIEQARPRLGFDIGGAVVKADSQADRDRLGEASRTPRWAIAYKYEAETATTVVRDIELGVGRTGRLSLRAHVDPVSVGGVTVRFASLHNVGWLAEQDIRIGDTVTIKRANDVIPYVSAPDLSLRPADALAWAAPEGCPSCGSPWDKSTDLWRCDSVECSVLGRLVYAVSRDALDVEGMSTAVVTALVETGRLTTVADLFTLTAEELATLAMGVTGTGAVRRLGAANAAKIAGEIAAAKHRPFARVLTALGIRKTGRTMSRRLAAHFHTMDALLAADVDALAEVEGIAAGKAATIVEDLQRLRPVIDQMAAAGVNMGSPAPVSTDAPAREQVSGYDTTLAGKKVAVTGRKMTGVLEGMSRTEVKELIEERGGKSTDSVTAATSLLVCASTTSSKYVKAQSLGVQTVSPEEFAAMLGLA